MATLCHHTLPNQLLVLGTKTPSAPSKYPTPASSFMHTFSQDEQVAQVLVVFMVWVKDAS